LSKILPQSREYNYVFSGFQNSNGKIPLTTDHKQLSVVHLNLLHVYPHVAKSYLPFFFLRGEGKFKIIHVMTFTNFILFSPYQNSFKVKW